MFDGAFGESIAFFEVEIDRVGGGTDGKNGVGVAPGEALWFGTATGGEAEEECHVIKDVEEDWIGAIDALGTRDLTRLVVRMVCVGFTVKLGVLRYVTISNNRRQEGACCREARTAFLDKSTVLGRY